MSNIDKPPLRTNTTTSLSDPVTALTHRLAPISVETLRQAHDKNRGWTNNGKIVLAGFEEAKRTYIGTMFLIAMVARIFEPGCKADYARVFQDGRISVGDVVRKTD